MASLRSARDASASRPPQPVTFSPHIDQAEPPLPAPAYYKCFVDASGGAIGGDAYSLAIAHKENERFIVDVVRHHFGPFDPVEITREYATLCKDYRISEVIGDLYGHSWVSQAWSECGIT
jgi:hypothetical protein